MGEFWKLAVSMTGISGVGAFVFFALYRRWLTPAILKGLGETSKLKLFQLFFCLTFAFGIATLILSAFIKSVDSSTTNTSLEQLDRTMKVRQATGEQYFKGLEEDPKLEPAAKASTEPPTA
jgi:hypothetical protein